MAETDAKQADANADEARQKTIAFSTGVINNAKELYFEFGEHKYRGDLLDSRLGEYILFRARRADDGLVRIPINYDLSYLRAIPEKGKPVTFKVRLLQKKIPHLLLSYPMEPEPEIVRKQKRRFMRVTTPLVLRRRDNNMLTADRNGIGTILDISEKGVMVETSLELEKEDRVNVFLNVSTGAEKKNLEMLCIVRRAERKGKLFVCGMEFFKPSEDSLRAVAEFLASR